MAWLVEMIAARFLKVFPPLILFMFTESISEWTFSFSDILAFRVVFAVWFYAFPILNTVWGGTIYRIYNCVGVACLIVCHLIDGRVKGQQVEEPFPHFFEAGAFF